MTLSRAIEIPAKAGIQVHSAIGGIFRFVNKQTQFAGEVMSRFGVGQIEYLARIDKIAEENPELSYDFVRDSLIARAEVENGLVDDYDFDS